MHRHSSNPPEKYDVVVSGAGPAGCMTAAVIAGAGHSVLVLEEHPEIGRPVQCAGIVEPRIRELVPFSPAILGEMRGARIFCGENKCLEFRADETRAVVIDRAEFDKQCAAHAASMGAEFLLSTRLSDARRENGKLDVRAEEVDSGKHIAFETKLLIGADGVASTTATIFGMSRPGTILSAFEIEATGLDEHPDDMVSLFYDEMLTPGFFAWVVPSDRGSHRYRIGVALDSKALREGEKESDGTIPQNDAPSRGENARRSLMSILEMPMFEGIAPLSYHAGGIPINLSSRFIADNVMLIGDAAGMVKPTSGGGINIALSAARHCARTAVDALERDDLSRHALRPYERAFLKEHGQELKKGLAMQRNFLYRPNRDISKLMDIVNREELRKLIAEKGDIDHPVKLAMALARREPRLMRYFFGYMKKRVF